MADYFTGGGAGMDVQAGTDGLQTLYLMNPNYVGYTDAAAAAPNMTLLNSAVSSLTPASFGHQPTPAAQHFVGIPLHPPPSGYNLWAPATTGSGGADVSPRQQAPGTSAVSAVLSLSSLEAPPVTVAAVPGTKGKYRGASPTPSQEHAVMSFKYLKVAQELLDEAVSVHKGVEEANAAAAVANSAMAMKKKEDSEGGSGDGAEDGGGSKSGAAADMSTAERQELQVKKSKLVNMLDELEQRYRQYHHQMQAVASSFEAVAGAGSARTYTALALRTISRQFRCLQDAIAAQVRSASRALGEDAEAVAGGRTVGSRLRSIDQQLRQRRALQQLGVMQGGAWRPQRGLPERSVSVLRAWLFEHFLHPYPRDSDKIMLAKQTGLTRSQVSNWFINARVRLWKPMVEEMYLEETKNKDANAAAGAGDENSGGGSKMSNNTDSTEPPNSVDNSMSSSAGATSKAARVVGIGSSKADVHASLVELAGDQHAQATYGGDDGSGAWFQHKLKKARTDKPAAFHFTDVATLQAQAAAAARHDEAVSHRELLMKFVEAGGSGATAGTRSQQDDDDVGGYSLFTPAPYGQFGSEQYAFAGYSGGVSLTLGLPHGATAAEQTTPFVMSSSNASDGIAAVTAGYDMNMQSTKSFAAQLMRDFVA